MVSSEVEHGEGDEGLGAVESVSDAGQEPDLGVGGFDECVGELVVQGGVDGGSVAADESSELDEGGEPASLCPCQPPVESRFAFFPAE